MPLKIIRQKFTFPLYLAAWYQMGKGKRVEGCKHA